MSGICGIVSLDGRPADAAEFQAMMAAGRHRGPDGAEVDVCDDHALGRLACHAAPGSHGPPQPCRTADGRFRLVADARIDNREEVRAALPASGRPPHPGTTDAALLLDAYLAWGAECCARLVGDYAFAIWDSQKRGLFAARDPLGMRPLYFAVADGRCYFASEVGQILATGRVSRTLSRTMVAAWLLSRGGEPDWSFFAGIRAVPGAHALRANADGHRLDRVWDVDPELRIRYRSSHDFAAHFRELLLEATRCRLQGEHRAGMLLSGGLDSCAVGGAAGLVLSREPAGRALFTTIAYRYEGFPDCDERHLSRPLAEHWGMDIREISSDLWTGSHLLGGTWGIDSPAVGIFRPLHESALALARELGIRRLLMAARGDNMVGGALWDPAGLLAAGAPVEGFRELAAMRRASGAGVRRTLRSALVRPWRFAVASRLHAWAARARPQAEEPPPEPDLRAHAPPWLAGAFLEAVPLGRILHEAAPTGFTNLARSKRWQLVHDRLTELGQAERERRSAVHGIRYEDPWSDRRILEFVVAVPQFVLNRVDDPKQLTRRSLAGLVPPAVQAGARKTLPAAFGMYALRQHEGRALLDLTSDMRLARAGIVHEAPLAASVREFLAGGAFDEALWPVVTLEAWLRHHGLEA